MKEVVVVGERRWLPDWEVRVAEPDEVFRFADGSTMDHDEALALSRRFEEADAGALVDQIQSRGRPLMGSAPARVVPVRLNPELVMAVDERAADEGCNRSELVRRALRAYLT